MQPPSTNGKYPAPRPARGAVAVPAPQQRQPQQRQPTRFPDALPAGGLDDLFFTLSRGTFWGFPLMRALALVVGFAALAWALRPLPGGVWVALTLLVALALIALGYALAARRRFTRFIDAPIAAADVAVRPAALPANEKLQVYLWGNLEVQGRVRSYAALPGFYRTFATREHALIGLAASVSRLGVARLPDVDAGLWYAFCTPAQIVSLRTGVVVWGGVHYPAIALEQRTARTQSTGRAQHVIETLYLGTRDDETRQRIWADLIVECADVGAAEQARLRHL